MPSTNFILVSFHALDVVVGEEDLPSLRLSSRSVLYWLQAFSCRHYRVSTPAGVLEACLAPDRLSFTTPTENSHLHAPPAEAARIHTKKAHHTQNASVP